MNIFTLYFEATVWFFSTCHKVATKTNIIIKKYLVWEMNLIIVIIIDKPR